MQDFKGKPETKAAGCFLEYEGHFLILQRSPKMPQGGKWGLPAGKVEKGENEKDAAIREVREETGFLIPSSKIEFLGEIRVDFPEKVTDFFAYRFVLGSRIEVLLDPKEHQAYAWVTGKEFYARNDLIGGVHRVLEKTGYASIGGAGR